MFPDIFFMQQHLLQYVRFIRAKCIPFHSQLVVALIDKGNTYLDILCK